MDRTHSKNKQVRSPGFISSDPMFISSDIVDWRMVIKPNLWSPPTDVYETDTKLVIRLEVAGMNEKDFNVQLEQNHLVISGNRPETTEPRAFHRMEIHYGEFLTEIELPSLLDLGKVDAEYRDGFLLVTIQKAHPKHIKVNE